MSVDIIFKELLAKILSFAMLTIAAFFTVKSVLQIAEVVDTQLIIVFSLFTMTIFYSVHRKFSDKISRFLRPRQDFKEVFRRYTETQVIKSRNVKELAELIVKTVNDSLSPQICSLMLLDHQSDLFNVIASSGEDEEIKSIAFRKSNHLIATLSKSNEIRLVVKDEVNKILPENAANLVRRDLEILNAQISLPLKLRGELVGLLNLGNKSSGELYTPEEMGFIFVFTTQSAMMLRFLEEISEFEKKLIQAEKMAGMTNLLDGLNHEFRNQLNSLRFFLTGAQEFGTEEDRKKYRKIALESMDAIVMILDAIQNYRETTDEKSIILTDIKATINGAILKVKPKLIKIDAKISTDISNSLPKIVTRPSFNYLLPNLLLNSYYALAARKKRFLDIKAYQTENSQRPIEIKITDTGGDLLKMMQKETLSSGGEYFPERSNVGGINYFLAKHIVDDHNGELEVDTNPPANPNEEPGTIFTIKLPLTQAKG
ncbi:GAF domain-containing protein [Candidatus Omnitrophota bacterium]